jgi:biotin operon repressor
VRNIIRSISEAPFASLRFRAPNCLPTVGPPIAYTLGMSKTIGQQILESIETTGVPIETVADYAGITLYELQEIIGGIATSYSLDVLCRIASSMGKVLGFSSTFRPDGSIQSHLEMRDVTPE